MPTLVTEKVKTYKGNVHKYLFGNTGDATLLTARPNKWAMSIHEANNNPFGAVITNDWFTNAAKRKSAVYINSWTPVSGNYENGISNTAEITFDFVPSAQTWNITHFLLWGVVGTNTLVPLYAGQFANTITLNQLQILYIAANNLTIVEN